MAALRLFLRPGTLLPSQGHPFMRFAYADPPYFGYGKFYKDHHPEAMVWDDIETHKRLVERLMDDYRDGWALSLTSGNLHDILPLCPKSVRIAAWVKPFCSFKKNVSPAYAWEPVLFISPQKHDITTPTVRDWLAENITLKKGLTGAKPANFARWVFKLLKAKYGDTLDDLFPGTKGVSEEWVKYQAEMDLFG
jgi:hypothetical protein